MSARTEDVTRALPAALHLEGAVLSCMMQAPDHAIGRALGILKPHHFHLAAHRIIFEILTEKHREGWPIDPLTVQQTLMDRNQVQVVGGPAAVVEIYTLAPSPAHVSHYAGQVRDKWMRRQIIQACVATMEQAFTSEEDAVVVLTKGENLILGLRDAEQKASRTLSGKDALFTTLDAIEYQMANKITMGTATGLPTLDAKMGGITQGLILIGGETSGGKSVIAMAWALALMRAGKRIRYYSLEMPIDQCMRRILAHLSGIPLMRLLNPIPALTPAEKQQLLRAGNELGEMAHLLAISDDSDLTASAIRAECRREHATRPLGGVLVDYIQKVTPDDPRAPQEQQLSASSSQLKKLADDLQIPVISPVQLNDSNATRGSKSLAMDCDIFVRIVHERDEKGEPTDPDEHGRRLCGLWVEKVRQGPRWFMIPAILNGSQMTFEEAPPGEAHPARKSGAPAAPQKRNWRSRKDQD